MPHEGSAGQEDRAEALRAESARWLLRARSNLARAGLEKPEEAVWEDFCFDAQQAAEKAVKALLVRLGVDFPRTHDIGDLLDLVDESGRQVPDEVRHAENLTVYAVNARYPDNPQTASHEDLTAAVGLARAVVGWVEREMQAVDNAPPDAGSAARDG